MKNITLKELAERLGVSVSTVSRALSDSYEINVETKKKIQRLAKELNYQPNPFASFLRKHKSNTIALIIPQISNNFFSLVIKAVEAVCQEKDYNVLIYESHESYQKEVKVINHLLGGRVDGVLISVSAETTQTAHLQEVLNRKIKLIMFDRVIEEMDVVKVTSNDYESTFEATTHLLNKGCKKILFFKAGNQLSTMHKRVVGYRDALAQKGLRFDNNLVTTFAASEEVDLEKVSQLIKTHRPDAVFCSVENLAIACYDVCRELNIKIPEEIKIVTFSSLKVARLLAPSLSTISQPAIETGTKIANLLIDEIEGKNHNEFKNIELKSQFIKRGSSN